MAGDAGLVIPSSGFFLFSAHTPILGRGGNKTLLCLLNQFFSPPLLLLLLLLMAAPMAHASSWARN